MPLAPISPMTEPISPRYLISAMASALAHDFRLPLHETTYDACNYLVYNQSFIEAIKTLGPSLSLEVMTRRKLEVTPCLTNSPVPTRLVDRIRLNARKQYSACLENSVFSQLDSNLVNDATQRFLTGDGSCLDRNWDIGQRILDSLQHHAEQYLP
jgi:hypothetical protein